MRLSSGTAVQCVNDAAVPTDWGVTVSGDSSFFVSHFREMTDPPAAKAGSGTERPLTDEILPSGYSKKCISHSR